MYYWPSSTNTPWTMLLAKQSLSYQCLIFFPVLPFSFMFLLIFFPFSSSSSLFHSSLTHFFKTHLLNQIHYSFSLLSLKSNSRTPPSPLFFKTHPSNKTQPSPNETLLPLQNINPNSKLIPLSSSKSKPQTQNFCFLSKSKSLYLSKNQTLHQIKTQNPLQIATNATWCSYYCCILQGEREERIDRKR